MSEHCIALPDEFPCDSEEATYLLPAKIRMVKGRFVFNIAQSYELRFDGAKPYLVAMP